jgi:hypothetical protein
MLTTRLELMGLSNEAAAVAVAPDGQELRITMSQSFPAFPFLRTRASPCVARALEVAQQIANRVPQKPLVSKRNSRNMTSWVQLHLLTGKDEAAPLEEEVMLLATLVIVVVIVPLVAEGKLLPMLSHLLRLWDWRQAQHQIFYLLRHQSLVRVS